MPQELKALVSGDTVVLQNDFISGKRVIIKSGERITLIEIEPLDLEYPEEDQTVMIQGGLMKWPTSCWLSNASFLKHAEFTLWFGTTPLNVRRSVFAL